MGFLRCTMVTLLLLLSVTGIRCEADSVAREREIKQLRLKISSLESKCIDQEKEIKEKDERLSLLEKSIQHKSTQIASFASEIELLKNRSVDDDEKVHKANVQNHFLEKQIDKLQIELETQVGEREALEAKVNKAVQTAQELRRNLEDVTKIKDRQRLELEQLDPDLKNAQNEIVKVHARANLKAEELEKLHGAWVPHWVTSHIHRFQEILSGNWNKFVRSALEGFVGRILEKLTHLRELIGSHVELAGYAAYSKTSDVYKICADAITPRIFKIRQTIRPYLQAAYSSSSDLYGACLDAIMPHFTKVMLAMRPYLQKVKKPFGSYIARAKTVPEPHATKVRLLYKHYEKSYLISMFTKVIDVVVMNHHRVQAITYEAFRKYELLRPLSTENITWLFASSLLCVPLIALYVVVSSIFCERRRSRGHRGASYKHRHRHEKERKV